MSFLKSFQNRYDLFDNFDLKKIANYSEEKMGELAEDTGIIRNKLKIKATVSNAQAFIKIQEEFGSFSKYIWGFVDGKPIDNQPKTLSEIKATTPISDALSKDLKKRGFKFVGSTVVILLFVTLFLRIIYLAEQQKTKFSRVYGYCVASILFTHYFVNITILIKLFTTIGVPLPFISYGGSSLWSFTILLFIFLK